MVAGTAFTQRTTREKGRGSPQSKPDQQDSLEAEHDRNQITAPVVLALHRAWYTAQSETVRNLPGEAGRWKQNVEGPWQVEAVDLVGSVSMTPQRDVARRERPLLYREARSPLPAPRLPPPLLGSSTDPEVQKHPREGLYPETLGKSHSQNSILGNPQHTKRT